VKVGLAEKLVETTRIRTDREQLDRTEGREDLAARPSEGLGLRPSNTPRGTCSTGPFPSYLVRDFLRVFRADAADPLTDPRLMNDYIDAAPTAS
jgi:hypothetical protein